ncbi:MFS transporter [Actinorhabdospora filicis]|uniref:MFS transporter n=1 Tax=Actinorhabdospora filicis TaxID=1785913 RepID=A0A9W6SJJ3_9ACTN|nr:MFS transporter [Actinorhabdospora filicis]GLZ77112.1 MFS transporter [Actinorhabdospora filicis]
MSVLLRDKRFVAFWLGQATAVTGNGLTFVALPGLLLNHHDGVFLAYVMAAQAGAGAFFTLLGGVLSDRYSRSLVMVVSDLLALGGLAGYLALAEDGPLWALIGVAVVEGIGVGLYQPAHRASMPQIVDESLLERANALDAATKRVGLAAGAALGGVFIASVSAEAALWVNVGTYAVSLATLLFLRLPAVGGGSGAGLWSMFSEAADGFRIVWRNKWATAIMLQGTVQVFFLFAPNAVLSAIVANDRYAKGAYGWITAVGFAGALVGSLIAGRVKPKRPGLFAMNALAPCALLPVCLVWDVPLWLWCAISFVVWVGISLFFVLWLSGLSRAFPAETHGRVYGLEHLLTFCLDPVAKAVVPALAISLGMGLFGIVAALVLLISTYAVLLIPGAMTLTNPEPSRRPVAVH